MGDYNGFVRDGQLVTGEVLAKECDYTYNRDGGKMFTVGASKLKDVIDVPVEGCASRSVGGQGGGVDFGQGRQDGSGDGAGRSASSDK